MTDRKPLRLRAGIIIALLQVLVMVGGPFALPDAPLPVGMIGGLVGALAILIWWLAFSRAPWLERIGAIVVLALGVLATRPIVHESIAGAGQGRLLYVMMPMYLALALVAWAAVARRFGHGASARRACRSRGARLHRVRDHSYRGRQQRRFPVSLALDADA